MFNETAENQRQASVCEKVDAYEAGEEMPGSDCQMVDTEYLRSLPQHDAPIVLYPDEYLKDPSRYVEIKKQSGRDAHYELLVVKFWTRRKSPYISRKNESNVQQRRLGEILC